MNLASAVYDNEGLQRVLCHWAKSHDGDFRRQNNANISRQRILFCRTL